MTPATQHKEDRCASMPVLPIRQLALEALVEYGVVFVAVAVSLGQLLVWIVEKHGRAIGRTFLGTARLGSPRVRPQTFPVLRQNQHELDSA